METSKQINFFYTSVMKNVAKTTVTIEMSMAMIAVAQSLDMSLVADALATTSAIRASANIMYSSKFPMKPYTILPIERICNATIIIGGTMATWMMSLVRCVHSHIKAKCVHSHIETTDEQILLYATRVLRKIH